MEPETEQPPRWVAVAAGVAVVAILTIGTLFGVVGLLLAWLASAGACGLVFRSAGDQRANRAAVAMIVVLPAAILVQSLVLFPLWSLAGPWAAGGASLVVTALTPTVALRMAAVPPNGMVAGRRRGAPGVLPAGQALWLRLGLAACTTAVVVTGHLAGQLAGKHGRLDEGFFALLLLDLVPVLVYVLCTHRPTTVMVCGFLVFALVAAGWALLKIEDGNQFAGLWVVYGWALALVVATAGALHDHVRRPA